MVSLRKYVWVNTSCICIPCNVHSVIFFFLPSWLWAVSGYCHSGSHTMSGKAKRNSKLTLSPSSCSTSPYVNISLAFVAPPIFTYMHMCTSHTAEAEKFPGWFFWIFFFFSFLLTGLSVTWVRVNWRSLICLSSWDPQLSLAGEAQPLLDQC